MIDWDTFKTQLAINPGKALKSVLLLAGCLLLIWLIVVMQSHPSHQQTMRVGNSGRLDSMAFAAGNADSLVVNQTQPIIQTVPKNQSLPGWSILLPSVLILLLFVGGVWLWIRSQKNTTSLDGNRLFTTVGSQQLPGGQQLSVIKLNKEYWVIATGGTQGVKLLHRYKAEEWQETDHPAGQEQPTGAFWDMLKKAASSPKRQRS